MDNNNITYRVVTNQGKEKEYSESEYLKNNVAGYLEKYLPGQYTVHKLEKVNNAVPQAILDDGDYLMSVPNLDGTMSSKVYKGKELKDKNLIDDYFDKNFLGKYTMQRVRSYDNADIAYRGDALEAKAYMDRNAIDDFDARNNAFMEEYKQKKAAYDLAAGSAGSWKDPNFLKTADYVVTSKEEYDKLKKERRRLQREYEDNPLVKGAYQNLAQSAQASADLNLEKENSSSGQDYNNYKHARKFDLDAAQLYALPVFTGDDLIDKDFWKGMGAGIADVFEDRDFWTLGITELARNVGVSKIFEGLKEKGLDISEMSEQDFDYYLTDSQKSLLFSFMRYGEAAAQRSGNMPKGYSVGQASAGTLGYMTQFLITGGAGSAIAKGVGKAATKAVAKGTANGLTKFLSRAYGKGVKGAIEQSVKRGMVSTLTADGNYLTSAMKPVINATAKTAGTVYEYGVKPIARSVARTPFMMSTYVAASEDLLERAQSTEELGSIGSAFLESVWNALPDQLIENWSEDMGPAIGAFGGAAKKGIMKAAGATVGKINVGKISLGQWGKWVADSYANKVLLQAGFNGLVGEMAEEWIGNAARVAVGLMDKEEFDEFASPKQQIEMAISFAPMSLLGLGSSSVAAAKQSKEYKSSVAEMRGVLNRAGMTEEEISDILDTKHSKQEIADALTPVLSKILSNATTENGQTTSIDDYKATLRFARDIAANEVMSAAEDVYKQELRMRVREQLSEELGAVSMHDPRGKFSYDIPMDGGNSLEAVTTVEDENGHKYYYMGEESSQVLLKPSNGGDVLFVDKKTYEDKASSGEYKVHTQSADSFLDAYASVEQEKAETAARDKHLNDSRKQIIDTYKTNPGINLGTNETPKVGTVTGFLPDGLVVEFENPVEINGVTKKIHKVSYEQAGNAIGVDSTYRTEAEVAQDEADSIMRKQKEVSVYNGQFKGMEFTNDGKLYKFVWMVDAPYQDENGVDVVKVAAQDGTEVVEVTMPLADLKDRLDKQKTAQLQAEQTKAGVDASKEDDGTPKDFRGNPLPMKTNDSGELEVDTDALWNKDPEAFLRWNDERRGGTTEDSQELLSANIAKLQAQRQALVDKKSVETVPSEREAIDGKILSLDNTINLYSAILQKYQAESNYKQKTQEYAAAFADLQRRMLNAKKQEQYDELKRAEAELMRKYLDETADSAQNLQLAKTCADLQLELNKFADMPVSMVTYANVESVMREDGASDEAIQSVLQKMAVVNLENLVNGHSYVLKGCHNNGMIYIFAEGNANIDSARTTYYHERQHELNARGDSAAVNEVMDLAKGDAEALYKTLEAIVGESVASNYKGSSAGVLADEIVAFTIQEAYSNENYTQALRDLGLSNELITIITKEYGRQTGKENSVSERSEDGHRDERRGGRKSANQNERADEGESSNEQLGGVRQGDTSEHGEEVVGRSLTSDEADALLAQMENSAEVAPEIELTPDNWLSQFGEDGLVDTPIGKVKMGENQYFKIILKKREKEFGMIYPTLSNPDIVIEEPSTSDKAERNTSLLFVKTFVVNGEKVKYYASVTVSKDNKEVVISNHFIEKAAFKKKLLADSTIYLKPSLSNSSDRHLAEHQDDVPDLLPTQDSNGSNSSSSEGTKSEPKKQDNNELSSFASEILNDTLAQLPEELKGRVTVNESSTGDESYENFIQSYNIDGKPSGITRIELFDAKINENPTSFVIDGSDVDASREEQDKWENLADEYMKEHPEVNLIKYDEVGIGFKSFVDAYNFLKWAEQRKESPIQGLENYSRGQIKEMVREHVARVLADAGFDVEVLDIEIHGSRARGDAKNESDLDVVVEYKGAEKEDGLFNVLNDEDEALFIDGIKVDINPIRAEESGTMSDYMKRSEAYDKEFASGKKEGKKAAKQSKENDTAQQQNESPREYVYRLNVRPFGIGNQPDGGRKVDDGSKFGAVAYDKPLSIDDIKHYSLTAITESKQLEGKMFSVPFGKNKLVYNIVSVDENGNITYTMKSTREGAVESAPQTSTYTELKDRFNGKETEVKVSADNENGQEPTSKQKVDSLGNPLNDDGTLNLEVVHSIDELTDEDFLAPTRNVQLPTIPKNIDDAIGAEGKPVIIKKNIFEKNRKNHSDLSSEQSRGIIESALYSPSMYGQNQKTSRPYNWILIHNAKKHSSIILEVNNNKDNVEIVNWHYLDDATLKQKEKQAIKEGGLILTLESAAGNTQDDLSFNDKGNKKEPKSQKGLQAPKAKRPDPLQFVWSGGEEVERPAMGGIYHTNGMIVATDARILLAIKSDYPAELEGKITDKQGQVIEYKYPNWKSPFDRKEMLPVDVNLEKLALFLEQIKSQVPTERQAKADTWKSRTVFIDFGNGTIVGFEYYRLVKFVNAARFLNAKLSLTNKMLFGEAEDGKLILAGRSDIRKAATFDAQKGEGKLLVDKNGDPLDNEEITSEPAQETPVSEQSPETRQEPKERIEDVGEKIAGARKDMLREYAASMGNVNVESLISLPFSKVFKRPNLNKAVENGALRARDARFAEAVMSAYLSNAKPRINPSSTSYKRNTQEKKIKEWAKKAYVGIQLLSELFNADEAERDAIIERVLSEKAYKEQEIEERKAELKSWNNGREYNGQCYPVNPVAVFMKVYEQLDYNTYGEQKCPIVEIEPASTFGYYRLLDANGKSKYYPRRKLDSVDAVIDEIVYATKLENADSDTDHPMSTLFFKGEGRTVVNGKVEYEKYNAFFDAYGKQVEIGQSFSSKEEGVSWVEEHHDEYNDIVNKQLSEEKAAKNERSQSQDVLVERYWDVGAKKSRYAITLSDKYVPKSRDVFNTMPYSIADGFETKEAAEKYLESHKAEIDSIIADIAQTRRNFTYFDGDAKSRVGEDYRKGKDVSAEEFRSTFGFRGVQFGEWANQADRQAALNNAYDSFLDLAKFLGISPMAISLNGELGMAFGSRGRGGKAAAHYELEEVVINLTKPSGAGSLAHEWWHALDNYFARQSNVPLGMVTETKTIPMRDEMRKAYNQLIDNVEKSKFNKRSRQRGAGYWGSMVEETARLFETWVFDELHKRGENNHFLTSQDPSYEETFARNSYRSYINMLNLKNEHRAEDSKEKVLTFEEFKETPMALMGYVYPTQKELTEFDHDLRNIFGTVRERTDEGTGKVALFSIGKKESSPSDALSNNTEAKQLAFDVAMTMLDNAGVPVESLSDEAMRQMAEMANALETASVQNEHQPTVVSSASGTKVIKDIDKLTKELQNVSNYPKTILGDIAKALGAEKHGSNSQYVTFEAKNGKVVTIRLASHNAKTSTFDNHGEDTGISIVISARENNGVNNDGKAHVTEFYYDAIKLRKAEGKPLVEIVKSIKQTLFSGEYKDTTGLAQIEEVNADAIPEFMTVYHGSGAKFDRFDHSHIGEGEGNQAYGWGTYVTEVEGIGRTYAEASLGKGNDLIRRCVVCIKKDMSNGLSFEEAKNNLIERLGGIFEKTTDESLYSNFRKTFEWLKTLSESNFPKRVLYTVDIPDDISSQPTVDELCLAIGTLGKSLFSGYGLNEVQIRALYNTTLQWYEHNRAATSDFFPAREAFKTYGIDAEAIDKSIRDKAMARRRENSEEFGNYLNWEGMVSAKQYPMWIKSMQVLGVAGNFVSVEEFKSRNDDETGISVEFEIEVLGRQKGAREVSKALSEAGFTGISYPAEYRTGGRFDGARNYVIFNENDAKIVDRIEFLRNGDVVYGATVGGKIFLNQENLNPNTPIHEYTHLWDKACQENNPELWLKGVELMRATPLWDELRNDPNYSALDDRALASEVHARLSGENGAAILEKMSQKVLDDKQSPVMAKAKKLAVIEELKDWLGDFWAWLKDTMTGWTREEASEVSLEDFIKMPISDLAKGVNLSYTKELSLFDDIDLQDNLDGPVRFSVAEDEANSIVEKAKADGTFMKAPNGKPSNLNERQWAQVRTTSFKNWFGDWEKEPSSSSKVIDENGEPLVVYHGGPYRFYEFDKSKMGRTTQAESAKRGFFFTDSRSLADLFAEGAADGSINEAELIDYIKRELSIKPDEDIKRFFDAYKESDLAYEEFLEENDGYSDYDFLRGYVYEYIPTDVEKSSERELMVNYILDSIEKEIWSGWFDSGSAISKKLSSMDIEWGHTEPVFLNLRNPIVDDIKRDYYNEGESKNPMAPVMDSARRLNRDGVIFTGIYEEGRHQKEIQYVVFEPNQIKTAVDNNGEFSADNDDIRYSIGDFRDGLDKQDDIYDAFVDILSSNGDAATLMEALEEYYNGSVRSASSGAKRAMEDGLLPFPGKQYAGKDFEYHHIMFESNDGDTFVDAVPFDTQDKVEAIIINKKFNNKLQEQIDGTLRNGFIYELGYPSNILINTGVPSLPIELSSSHLAEKAKQRNHQFDLSDIKDLPIALQNPIAVFAYGNKDKAQNIIVAIERDEKKFVVGIHFNQERKGLVVNDIRGIFNKDNAEWLNWINQGKALYLNKEEIQALIDKQRTNLAEVEYLDLDSVAKIVKDFENPISVDEAELEESVVRYSIVNDPATLRRLDAEPKMKVYRAMQLVDGKLYPPMSGKVNGEWREGLSVEDLGKVWEQADENPELVDENGRFTLNKGNGKSLKARYNPYIHTSVTPLNDQFSSAQDRPELVTVEVEVPVSELYSQYKAEKAKDKVGAVEWKAGVVQAKLSGKRTVVLSRWDRPMRIVPNSEVADEIVKMFNGKKITMPSNVVTPELRAELEKRGVPFVETDNKGNRIKDSVEFSIGEGLSEVNEKFNEDLSRLTEANADSITLSLGKPSQILVAAGVIDKPMKLYGNKVIKKMKKHGFELDELMNLPRAVSDPIAVFNNYGVSGNRSILTELKTTDGNFLVTIDLGTGKDDIDFNIVSTVFGKDEEKIVNWINNGFATYINKEKALNFLHHSAPIAETSGNSRLSSAAKVVKDFVNPTLRPEDSVEFSIESLDNKNELLFGQLERTKAFDVLMGIYDALPDDVRGEINKRAPSFGYNFASATADYFAKLSIKEGSFSKEEWALIRDVRDLMKSHLGIRELSLYDALWALCRMAYKDQLDILSSAYKALAAHKLGFSTSELTQERSTTDAVNFSISEDMKSSSAAEMYAKATSYFKNRLKEGAVDMFTSINDLVEAIELATGDKADAFEDIRLALNQQSSKGLAEMENYTRAYLQPMFDTIGRIVNNTGLSYEDLSRYVVLKHAVERNVVFAKRDAKAFYKNILNSTVNTLEKDNTGLNKKRKSAVMDGDREALAAIDKQIDDNNVLIAKAKADYEAALKRIESGNDIKYNEFREQDYGGLTSMYSEYPGLQPRSAYKTDEAYNQAARKVRKPMFDNVADMEEAAIKEVADFENKITMPVADELWDRINAATKATLDGQYQSNMLSKEQYEAVRGQFKYYVPLRGFKDITAEDIWSYYNSSRSDSFAPAIISAKGRTTEAENPFNWIGTMASSSIAAGVKNRTKLALYYFIANRPNQDLVSLGETWYRYDAQATSDYQSTHPGSTKRIFSAVYPPVTEGLDHKAAKEAYAAWENDLKAAKEKGEAYQKKGKLNVNDDVAFIDAKQTPEHIIRCRVLGSEVDMIINSNPRAAQAVNGLLNLETDKDYKVVFGKILRYLSAINTSLNPEFWISNMQRDLLFGVMSSFINGNDVKSFGKNILSPRRLMKLMRSYRNGTLGNSKLESYYREFAENGAITGYTVINSNDYWEQKIQATIDPKFPDKVKASKFLAAWQNLGEATEQMTRFAAYVTARENGQDVVTAVSAAKEITVNFNRKGSGKAISMSELRQLLKKNGEHLNEKEIVLWHVVSFIPAYGRRTIMFFNAGVQALNAMYKLYAKDSRRFASCMLGYFLLGVAGALAHGLLGGDDDDNDYLDMPDYTRQNNLLLGCNGIYFKWALPQEARVFYAFGDMFVNHLMGRSPHKNLLKEMSGAINDMLPLPLLPFGVEFRDFVRDFVPSVIQPLADIASNKDFTGSRVYNDLKYLSDEERKRTPRYQYALSGTGSGFVDASKFLNILSGGNEYDAGWVNVPPEVMQHIVETLGGGLLTTVNRGIRTLSGTVDAVTGKDVFNQDLSVRNAPFLNRVLIVNDERTRNAYVTGLFNYYKSEALHAKSVANRIGKKEGLSAKRKYMHSSDYEVYKVYDKYQSELKRYDSQIREETDAEERKSLMRRQDEVRRRMVKEMTTKNR